MKCGETIFVKNVYGAFEARLIAQCHGGFMLITHTLHARNGFILPDWKAALRELIALAVPAKLTEQTRTVESTASGLYVGFPLTYPLSVKGLADLFGVEMADVRVQLEDMAVGVDG
jgi:hypothetical protein